jgi:trk system potassium uptake protein
MPRSQVVVVGLGRFGISLARTLSELGHEVLGLDRDPKHVEIASEFVTQAVLVDATDEEALAELGVKNFDIGVVSIASDIKSSILVTVLLKRLGVGTVIAKAQDELHGDILSRVGADRVVYPERETGIRIAHAITTPHLVDYLEITSGYGIGKVVAPPAFAGKRLEELELKKKSGVTVLVICHGNGLILNPDPDEVVSLGDVLVVAGKDRQIEAIQTT